MKTLVIYNKTTGKIIMTQSGDSDFSTEIGSIVTDVPNGKHIISINLETGEVILADNPKTEEQLRLDALEAQIAALAGSEV